MPRLNTGLSLKDWGLMFALGIPPVVIVMIITWVYLAPDEPLVDPNATPTPIETPAPTFTPEEGGWMGLELVWDHSS